MPRDVSIMVSVKDGFSSPLSKADEALQKAQRRVDDLGNRIDKLNKKKAVLTVDAENAKKELKAAKKAFDDTEESARRLQIARYHYDSLQSELKSISSEAKAAQKQLDSLHNTVERQKNRAGGIAGNTKSETSVLPTSEPGILPANETGILSKLGQAGASQLLGQVASEAANAYVSSAFGSEAGTMFSSVLGMTASGAAIGSMIAPGVGTAIGAGAGALLGGISGATQNFQSRDEYFKSLVQDRYNAYQEEMQNSLTGGSETAASREQSQLAFSTLLGGDAAAESFLTRLQDVAETTPFSRAGLEAIAKNLIANGFSDTAEQFTLLDSIGEAGSALGLSEQSMAEVATYLGRMNATDKANLEYLNPLIERGIPAIEYLAENMGVSNAKMYDMISAGDVLGSEAARVIAAAMQEDFGGSLEKQAQSYTGLMSTLEDAREELDAAMGEGYNEARKPAIQEEIDYLSGEGGEEMKKMYSLIGEFQASLENEKERAIREAMDAVTDTNEYREAELAGNGAKMGELLAEAKAQAEKKYMESDGYQTMMEAQTSAIERVRDTMADSYWQAGYYLGEEFNKGLEAAQTVLDKRINENLEESFGNVVSIPENVDLTPKSGMFSGFGHAAGLSYVPYDNYPALLHEGERVLTARENRGYGGGVNVSVTGNNFTVREEADIDRIAETIARKVTEARELMV